MASLRRHIPRTVVGLLLAGALAPASSADFIPPNDDWQYAIPIPPSGGSFVQHTFGAGLQAGEQRPCGGIASTVWFTYTPAHGGYLRVATDGSEFDTVVAVYTEWDMPPLGCDNDGGLLSLNWCPVHDDLCILDYETSMVLVPTFPWETYYIQAGGWYGRTGALVLTVTPV